MKMQRFVLFLLLSFLALPCHVLGEKGLELYDLTTQYGIDAYSDALFTGKNQLFITTEQTPDESTSDEYIYEVRFLSLDEQQPRFIYSTHRSDALYEIPYAYLLGEKLYIVFYKSTFFVDDFMWDDTSITVDTLTLDFEGNAEWNRLPIAQAALIASPMPGTAQILERNGCLYLQKTPGSPLVHLLGDEEENAITSYFAEQRWYSFLMAVDENQFVYSHIGWEGNRFGSGLYNLETGENWIISLDEGMPGLILDGKLYTTKEIIDLETRTRQPHAQIIQDWHEDYYYTFANQWVFSPDGRVMCCIDDSIDGLPALNVYDVHAGKMIGFMHAPQILGTAPLSPMEFIYPPCFVDSDTVRFFHEKEGHLLVAYFHLNALALEPLPD